RWSDENRKDFWASASRGSLCLISFGSGLFQSSKALEKAFLISAIMIHIRTKDEIEIIRRNALMVTATLTEVAKLLKPGITTISIDKMAEQFIRDNGGVPSFKGYGPSWSPFPYSLCISVNEVVVHGFPGDYELKDGDVVSVDCGF